MGKYMQSYPQHVASQTYLLLFYSLSEMNKGWNMITKETKSNCVKCLQNYVLFLLFVYFLNASASKCISVNKKIKFCCTCTTNNTVVLFTVYYNFMVSKKFFSDTTKTKRPFDFTAVIEKRIFHFIGKWIFRKNFSTRS